MPRRCSAVNMPIPCSTGTRKSSSPCTTSVGVRKLFAYVLGLHFLYASGLSQGVPRISHSGNHSSSVEPYPAARSYTPSWLTRHLNRSVCPAIQSIM